jgi:NADH-quinone oxidoreductase subunit G
MRLLEDRPHVAAMRVALGSEAPLAAIPGLSLRRERAANLHGARLLGVDHDWSQAINALDGAGLAVVVDADLDDQEAAALAGATVVVHLATVADPRFRNAALLLPITSMAEEQGVYVNRDGRAQRYLPARTPPGMARPGWWVAAATWARLGADRTAPATAPEAFAALRAFDGLSYATLGLTGAVVVGATAGATS